jgi:hypothetical protein
MKKWQHMRNFCEQVPELACSGGNFVEGEDAGD